MKTKLSSVLIGVVILSLVFTGVAYAEEDKPQTRIRVWGEIMWVDLRAKTFGLQARSGEEYRFEVDRSTHFRSPDGSVNEFLDLEAGMRALVVGFRSEEGLIARLVVAVKVEPRPERIRVIGEISGIISSSASFTIQKRDGDVLTIHTIDRTRFRSRDGSIQGFDDLEIGMIALVIGLKQDDGSVEALIVVAGHKEDIPENLRRFRGEITVVLPDRDTFTLQTIEGASVTFQTGDRTRFVSRDGSVTGIDDLKVGMVAHVGALEREDGLLALLVAVEASDDTPERVWGRGTISSLGDRVFTIERQDGSEMTLFVDNSTRYRSRDGSIAGFEDLQVGMFTIVGALKLEDGQLRAVFVGVARAAKDTPSGVENRSDQPDRQIVPINPSTENPNPSWRGAFPQSVIARSRQATKQSCC